MRRRLRKYLIAIILSAALLPAATPYASGQNRDTASRWEQIDNPPSTATSDISRISGPEGSAEISVVDGYVYITLDQPAAVKLFTILGQPVSQVQLHAGTSRFRVGIRGIYILKIGSTTRRITI